MSGPAVADQWVQQAQQLVERKRSLLRMQYPEGVTSAALTRAWESARKKAAPIRQQVQSQAFYDLLVVELDETDHWCQRFVQGMRA